jgi:hypothetical protein
MVRAYPQRGRRSITAMPRSEITLRVVRRGPRTEEVLRATGTTLGQDGVEPDDRGVVRLVLSERGPAAWDRVRDALDDAGSDWRQWLHLEARPRR